MYRCSDPIEEEIATEGGGELTRVLKKSTRVRSSMFAEDSDDTCTATDDLVTENAHHGKDVRGG